MNFQDVVTTCLFGERSNHDTLASVFWTSGQSLPEILSDIWHVWVEQFQSAFETCVEGVLSRNLFSRLDIRFKQWFRGFLLFVSFIYFRVRNNLR
jgi:hypothetical protein